MMLQVRNNFTKEFYKILVARNKPPGVGVQPSPRGDQECVRVPDVLVLAPTN